MSGLFPLRISSLSASLTLKKECKRKEQIQSLVGGNLQWQLAMGSGCAGRRRDRLLPARPLVVSVEMGWWGVGAFKMKGVGRAKSRQHQEGLEGTPNAPAWLMNPESTVVSSPYHDFSLCKIVQQLLRPVLFCFLSFVRFHSIKLRPPLQAPILSERRLEDEPEVL